jgi:hypothetical protein
MSHKDGKLRSNLSSTQADKVAGCAYSDIEWSQMMSAADDRMERERELNSRLLLASVDGIIKKLEGSSQQTDGIKEQTKERG